MEPIRRRSDNSTKQQVLGIPSEPAKRLSTDTPTHARPQPQPTMFAMDIDSLASTKASDLALETANARNVVIFGDSGVGKSSLINMLAGRKTAQTSNGVLGCTFQSRRHTVTINRETVNIWDTAGLDEGTRGRVSPEMAEKNLTKLLRELRCANGIHLLVYCIRGSSVRKSLARNYAIFYSAICRKKVPIVAVVTGLENEPVSMDDWWINGEKELARYKMRFDDHACVTTIDMEKLMGSVFEERGILSQQLVRKLIIDNCRLVATRPPSDTNVLIKAALLDFRSMVRSGWESVQRLRVVFFYQADVPFFHPGVFGDLKRVHSQINGCPFVFQHAGDLSERYITPKSVKGGADLLVFAGSMSGRNVERFHDFYTSCGGEVCPLLVVTDGSSVEEWTEYFDARGIRVCVATFPSPTDGQMQSDLCDLMDELCLVRGSARYRKTNFLKFFGRKDNVADELRT